MHTGSCQCSSICYQYSGEPLTCYACHCTDCQTTTGSAFTLSMIVNAGDLAITKGELAVNHYSQNGTDVKRHHCANCGSAIWFSSDSIPNLVALKPGTFNNTEWFKPVAHIWVKSAQPWIAFSDTDNLYDTQPKMNELIDLWNRQSRS